jgi:hypothetical protein
MVAKAASLPERRVARPWHFLLGWVLAATALLALAEAFLHFFPPRDLHPYLGEESPLTGLYVPDQDFGITYRSWDAFRTDYADRLALYLPFHDNADRRKVWAFFGNSFVQAPDMLADHARAGVPERKIFNLGRNEILPLRFAQVKLLLENGLEPERLFIELMPVDALPLGKQPLDSMRITSRGALTYTVRSGRGPTGWLVQHSRLALTAWVRAGRQGNPRFNARTLYQQINPELLDDLRRLFAGLMRHAHQHNVPVTVLLLPAYHQVTKGASFGFQDTLAPMLRELGCDVFDPRDVFCRHDNAEGLFLPDKHFNDAGNRLLLVALLRHLHDATQPPSRSLTDARVP